MIIIIRNKHDYGPYDEQEVARYVSDGIVLMNDIARDAATGETTTVGTLLLRHGIRPSVANSGSIGSQLRHIGPEFIFPREELQRSNLLEDKRLLMLAIVGLSLSVFMILPIGGVPSFYAISLYFAVIWGLFFAYLFPTRQVSAKTAVATFFLTQAGVFVIFGTLHYLNFFYVFTRMVFPFSIVGYVLGVGLTEEFTKMVPLFIIQRRAREPMLPQSMVYYGLMAGIAFGVFEGVEYQTTVNIQADYTTAFVLNIARLTSLPFLHAIWCGIAGYFIGMAGLYPRYRHSLWILALVIPATLHGLYDSFAGVAYIISLFIAFGSVLLLMAYLRKSKKLRERLHQPA